MTQEETARSLKASIGKTLDIVLDGIKTTVTVVSVDSDGVLCKPVQLTPDQPTSEFWVAFQHIDRIELRPSAVN